MSIAVGAWKTSRQFVEPTKRQNRTCETDPGPLGSHWLLVLAPAGSRVSGSLTIALKPEPDAKAAQSLNRPTKQSYPRARPATRLNQSMRLEHGVLPHPLVRLALGESRVSQPATGLRLALNYADDDEKELLAPPSSPLPARPDGFCAVRPRAAGHVQCVHCFPRPCRPCGVRAHASSRSRDGPTTSAAAAAAATTPSSPSPPVFAFTRMC